MPATATARPPRNGPMSRHFRAPNSSGETVWALAESKHRKLKTEKRKESLRFFNEQPQISVAIPAALQTNPSDSVASTGFLRRAFVDFLPALRLVLLYLRHVVFRVAVNQLVQGID